MAKKNTKETTLENILFNCRNALRGAGGTEKKSLMLLLTWYFHQICQ